MTSAGDIPDHHEVEMIEENWKAYRNIIRGGFFFNDSVIALADYIDDEKDNAVTKDVNEYTQTQTADNLEETKHFSDFLDDEMIKRESVEVRNNLLAK